MTDEVVVRAPAKVNLFLGVGPLRDDGYHALATVYQAVDLYDEVRVRASTTETGSVTVRTLAPSIGDVPTDQSNIAARAAALLAAHHGLRAAVDVTIDKRIPVAGGMAGGSADGAATLVACDTLWGTATPEPELLGIAARLGSDVPFALLGGTAIGTGRGEAVSPVVTRGAYWWVVLESPEGLSTPAVYREFDTLHAPSAVLTPEIPAALLEGLLAGDVDAVGRAVSNDLEPAALRMRPDLRNTLARGRAASARAALVSGSGPTCLFLAATRGEAENLAEHLADLGPVRVAQAPVPGAHVVGTR